MGSGSTCSTPTSCSACSSACTGRRTTREPGWGWLSWHEWSTGTAGASGPRPSPKRARRSSSRWRATSVSEAGRAVEILLVEDNPNDVQLTLHAFSEHNLGNRVHVVRDGAEALEFVFATGRYADRPLEEQPRVILLDLKLPLVDGREVLRRIKGDDRTRMIPVVVLTSSAEERDIVESY